jgi:hypothetical protein
MKSIEESEGYKKLLASVEKDEKESPGFHDYKGKFSWVIERVKNYAEKTGLEAADILNTWEKHRTYWYMNYYQDSNQPLLDGKEKIRIFEIQNELRASIGNSGFRCPACGGVSKNPYECDTGKQVDGHPCDWKAYGLLGCLDKGAHFFLKDKMRGETIFMPVAWEGK